MRFTLAAKLVSFIGALMLALTSSLAYLSWHRGFKNLEERFGLVLKHIAINTALQIDGYQHSRIRSSADKHSREFKKIHALMQKAMLANYLSPETFYTFQLGEDHALHFAVMLHKEKFIGDRYDPPALNKAYFMRVMAGESVFTQIYTDAHGTWISGLAPIFTGDKVTGVVEADFRLEKFVEELRQQTLEIVEYSLVVFIVAVLLAFWFMRRITNPIKVLSRAAVAVADGTIGNPVSVTSHDEIGELQQSFNTMLKSISERYLMLKYLSPHTKRMIEQEIHDPQASAGRTRDVVLLFSDIRGFTGYSANRDPREVIENLNTLLGKQAEIIESYGGDIDKFVGDEVIAVFEGEKAEELALRAAVTIQRMVTENLSNPEFDMNLRVGIGIASGEVFMGNIGSVGRKDFTVIGSNVNLASRICSAAMAGEILMSSHVFYKIEANSNLPAELQITLVKKGNLKAKGFPDLIPVYSCEIAFATAEH